MYKKVKKYLEKFYVYAIILALIIYSIHIVSNGTIIFYDADVGLSLLANWQNGSDFNHFSFIDLTDNCKEKEMFFSWFSPGQYLVPYIFTLLINSTPIAINVLCIICGIIAVIGYYKLYQYLLPNKRIVAFCLIFIVLNKSFYWHYFLYWGGETLMLATAPWFCYFLLTVNTEKKIRYSIISTTILLIGLFLKLSFLIQFSGILFFVFINDFLIAKKINNKWFLFAIFWSVAIFCVWFFYLKNGVNPSNTPDYTNTENIPNSYLADLVYPLSAYVSIYFKTLALLFKFHQTFKNIGLDLSMAAIPFACISLWLIYKILVAKNVSKIELLSICIFIISSLYFIFFYLQNVAVSYEVRHYYFLGNICGPAILVFLHKHYKLLFKIVLVYFSISIILDVSFFIKKSKDLSNTYGYIDHQKTASANLEAMHVARYFAKNKDYFIVTDFYYQNSLINTRQCASILMHPVTKKTHQYIGMQFINWEIKKLVEINTKKVVCIFNADFKQWNNSDFEKFFNAKKHSILKLKKAKNYTMCILSNKTV